MTYSKQYPLNIAAGGTNVKDGFVKLTAEDQEVYDILNAQFGTTGHDHDGTDGKSKKINAINVVNTPAGTISATNVQAAINELDTEKETPAGAQAKADTVQTNLTNHINDTIDAHLASAIGNTPSGNITSTTVQAALNELDAMIEGEAQLSDYSFTPKVADIIAKRPIVDVRAFGAVGDYNSTENTGTDDTVAIQNAINYAKQQGLNIKFHSTKYKVSSVLSFDGYSGIIDFNRASIYQTSNLTTLIYIVNSNDVTVVNGRFFGVGTDYTGSTSSARGIYIYNSSNIKILNNRLDNFSFASVMWYQSSNIFISQNNINGPGSPTIASNGNNCFGIHGYVNGSGYPNVRIINNEIRNTAQGIKIDENFDGLVIFDNLIKDIVGQHGMYINTTTNSMICRNVITGTYGDGIKIQNNSTATSNTSDLIVSNNQIYNCGNVAIELLSLSTSYGFKDIDISNNLVVTAGNGISVTATAPAYNENINISYNVIGTTTSYGIYANLSKGLSINKNTVKNTSKTAILSGGVDSSSSITVIDGNTLVNPANNSGSSNSAIDVGIYANSSTSYIRNNVIVGESSPFGYSVYTGTLNVSHLENNHLPIDKLVRLDGTISTNDSNIHGGFYTYPTPTNPLLGRGKSRDFHADAAPASGTYIRGDKVWTINPAAAGYLGYVCTASGTPGTWKGFGAIQA